MAKVTCCHPEEGPPLREQSKGTTEKQVQTGASTPNPAPFIQHGCEMVTIIVYIQLSQDSLLLPIKGVLAETVSDAAKITLETNVDSGLLILAAGLFPQNHTIL